MKKMKEEMMKELIKERMTSRNAFRVSKKTKSIRKEEEYDDTEDEDYYEDAPIINIKFKRDTSSFLLSKQTHQSILVQKLQKSF